MKPTGQTDEILEAQNEAQRAIEKYLKLAGDDADVEDIVTEAYLNALRISIYCDIHSPTRLEM